MRFKNNEYQMSPLYKLWKPYTTSKKSFLPQKQNSSSPTWPLDGGLQQDVTSLWDFNIRFQSILSYIYGEIEQFAAGLESFNVLKYIKKHQDIMRVFFVNEKVQLTAI